MNEVKITTHEAASQALALLKERVEGLGEVSGYVAGVVVNHHRFGESVVTGVEVREGRLWMRNVNRVWFEVSALDTFYTWEADPEPERKVVEVEEEYEEDYDDDWYDGPEWDYNTSEEI